MIFKRLRFQCRQARPLLWEYAGERLPEGTMEMVERHLADCPYCQREVGSLRQAHALLAAYRQQEMPAPRSGWESLRSQLLEESLTFGAHRGVSYVNSDSGSPHRASQSDWRLRLTMAMAGSAVTVVVAAIGYSLLWKSHSTEPDKTISSGSVAVNPLRFAPGSVSSSVVVTPPPKDNPETESDSKSSRTLVTLESGPKIAPPISSKNSLASAENKRSRARRVKSETPPGPRLQLVKSRTSAKDGRVKMQEMAEHLKPPISKQDDDETRGPAANEMQTVSASGRYIMGSLVPMPRDDDSVY